MSMDTYVIGIKPADEKFKRMKAIYDACNKEGIEVPDEVQDFFDYEEPDSAGVKVDIKYTEFSDNESAAGIEVKISDLPKDVKVIRFVNSY